ncbi:cytochrome p450 domain-containing protein [Ditylenchus destructor]|uniref:Cytochrome p450 domain-containing protein n=1 Tax=Ditylenchus destructor TaxID=166010 RepID=A0AAD4N938_9BILA|nr:cytochrome p450 domain-containing protein [Ditylenchus destructor]
MRKNLALSSTLFSTILAVMTFTILRSIRLAHVFNPVTYTLFSVLFGLYLFHDLYWKRRKLPPGPTPWLLAGNMSHILLNPNIDKLFLRWRQQYGGIFTFWMGPIPMVMVADVDTMKKYFVRHGDVFSGRWQNFITDTFMGGHNGVVQIQGEKWREQRRFSLQVLRDFGLGKSLMEEKILNEVNHLISHLDSVLKSSMIGPENGVSMQLTKPISVCIANIINNILFGRTFAHDDPGFIQLQEMLDKQSALVVRPIMGLYLTMPFTVQIPIINSAWLQLIEIRNNLWSFLERQIQEHRMVFRSTMQPTDFTFVYMMEMHKRRQKGEHMGHFSDKQLKMLLLDLFFAGSETTVTTTKWGILMLVLHPEVQQKCQEELDAISGDQVELKDRIGLTYLQATICEIQRIANILPINLLRTCTETVSIDSFEFEAGTMVLPQISIAMNDPQNFSLPEEFRPERFIDENCNLKKNDGFMPFSIGARKCLGESLARAELFLIFANLLKNFEFSLDKKESQPSTQRSYGLTVSPKPFKCVLRRRVPDR